MKTLLVIDDEASDRELVRITLGDAYSVSEAADIDEALEKLRDGCFCAVLLDLLLFPPIDVADSIRRIHHVSPKSAVVVFSGTSNPTQIGDAILAGADHYVQKPTGVISREYLLSALDLASLHRRLELK